MDDIKLNPAERSTQAIDVKFNMYDHFDVPDPTPTPEPSPTPTFTRTLTPTVTPTPTFTHSPTHTATLTQTLTITPTQTLTHTVSFTPTQSQTPTPSVTPTGTIFFSAISDIRHFANDAEITGQNADVVVCKCAVSGLTSDTDNALFVIRETTEEIVRLTLDVADFGRYKIVSSIGTFSTQVLSGDGKTYATVPYACRDLVVPRMTDANSSRTHMVILKKGNEYFVMGGGDTVVNQPAGAVVVPGDDTEIALTMPDPASPTVIQGHHMYALEDEGAMTYSVEDAVPDTGYAFDVHKYAYTFVCRLTVHHGVLNVKTPLISKNDVVLVYDDVGDLVGVSSIFTANEMSVQVYTNNTTDTRRYVFKIVKYESKKIIQIGSAMMSSVNATVSLELGSVKKALSGTTWVSANVDSEDKKLGTYFKSVIDAVSEIKSQNGVVRKNNGYYVGTLDVTSSVPTYDVTYLQFYMIKTTRDVNWELYGKPLIDIEVEHHVSAGENWVSSHSVNDVPFADWISQYPHVDSVVGQGGFMTLDDKGDWTGNISFIKPNEGYIIRSKSSYVLKKVIRQYETTAYSTTDSHTFYTDGLPMEGTFTASSETAFVVTLNDVSFVCAVVASDKKYHDSNIRTVVPTYFESAETATPLVVDGKKITKIRGVLSYVIDEDKNTHLSGFIDPYVVTGNKDGFTAAEPYSGWYSAIEAMHADGLKIKKY